MLSTGETHLECFVSAELSSEEQTRMYCSVFTGAVEQCEQSLREMRLLSLEERRFRESMFINA